jgi:hypothetical protein
MAALTPATLNSTTLEAALLEILRLIADRQSSTTTNQQNRTIITQFTQNELTGVFTVGLSIPSTLSYGASGLVANATEVFS